MSRSRRQRLRLRAAVWMHMSKSVSAGLGCCGLGWTPALSGRDSAVHGGVCANISVTLPLPLRLVARNAVLFFLYEITQYTFVIVSIARKLRQLFDTNTTFNLTKIKWLNLSRTHRNQVKLANSNHQNWTNMYWINYSNGLIPKGRQIIRSEFITRRIQRVEMASASLF